MTPGQVTAGPRRPVEAENGERADVVGDQRARARQLDSAAVFGEEQLHAGVAVARYRQRDFVRKQVGGEMVHMHQLYNFAAKDPNAVQFALIEQHLGKAHIIPGRRK